MRVWLTGDTEKKSIDRKEKRKDRGGKAVSKFQRTCPLYCRRLDPFLDPVHVLPSKRHAPKLVASWTSRRGRLLAFLSHLSFRPFRERQPFYYIPCRCERPATPERVHSIKRRRFDRFIIDTNRAPFCFSLMLPLHSRKH